MRHIYRCVALALVVPLGALRAQDTTGLARGARVRVRLAGTCEFTGPSCPHRSVVGTLDSIDSLTIVVHNEAGEAVRFPRLPNTRIDASAGPGACTFRRGNCVAIGVLGGAALGALAGWIYVQSQGGAGSGTSCQENLCELVYLFTVPAGALVGTIVGASVGGEDWKQVEPPVRVGVRPDGVGGIAVGVSVPF